jgi:hypothetical protein
MLRALLANIDLLLVFLGQSKEISSLDCNLQLCLFFKLQLPSPTSCGAKNKKLRQGESKRQSFHRLFRYKFKKLSSKEEELLKMIEGEREKKWYNANSSMNKTAVRKPKKVIQNGEKTFTHARVAAAAAADGLLPVLLPLTTSPYRCWQRGFYGHTKRLQKPKEPPQSERK